MNVDTGEIRDLKAADLEELKKKEPGKWLKLTDQEKAFLSIRTGKERKAWLADIRWRKKNPKAAADQDARLATIDREAALVKAQKDEAAAKKKAQLEHSRVAGAKG